MKMNKRFLTAAALLTWMAQAVTPVQAGDVQVTHFGKRTPTTAELIHSLAPTYRTRGISLEPVQPKAISLEVRFAFDSAELTPDAKRQLAPLGEALGSDDLAGLKFRVEGHTDAVGSDVYNLSLSQRRAQSVARFLHGEYQVEPARLEIRGKGESELLDASNPSSGANRRVQVVTQ